jgi:hypothetical protein
MRMKTKEKEEEEHPNARREPLEAGPNYVALKSSVFLFSLSLFFFPLVTVCYTMVNTRN